jgi:hypothetical protein
MAHSIRPAIGPTRRHSRRGASGTIEHLVGCWFGRWQDVWIHRRSRLRRTRLRTTRLLTIEVRERGGRISPVVGIDLVVLGIRPFPATVLIARIALERFPVTVVRGTTATGTTSHGCVAAGGAKDQASQEGGPPTTPGTSAWAHRRTTGRTGRDRRTTFVAAVVATVGRSHGSRIGSTRIRNRGSIHDGVEQATATAGGQQQATDPDEGKAFHDEGFPLLNEEVPLARRHLRQIDGELHHGYRHLKSLQSRESSKITQRPNSESSAWFTQTSRTPATQGYERPGQKDQPVLRAAACAHRGVTPMRGAAVSDSSQTAGPFREAAPR